MATLSQVWVLSRPAGKEAVFDWMWLHDFPLQDRCGFVLCFCLNWVKRHQTEVDRRRQRARCVSWKAWRVGRVCWRLLPHLDTMQNAGMRPRWTFRIKLVGTKLPEFLYLHNCTFLASAMPLAITPPVLSWWIHLCARFYLYLFSLYVTCSCLFSFNWMQAGIMSPFDRASHYKYRANTSTCFHWILCF